MASFNPAFHTGLSPPATASQGTGGSVADETASSGIRESPLVRSKLGDSRAHGVRPAVPARSHVVGAGQPAANSQGVQAAPVVTRRTRKGVGAGQPAAEAYSIMSSGGSDVASVASSAQLELAMAREEVAQARLARVEAEVASSKRSSRSKSSRGSGTHVPIPAEPAEAPRGLPVVPEAALLPPDPVRGNPRPELIVDEASESGRGQPLAGDGATSAVNGSSNPPGGDTYNSCVVNHNTLNLDASTHEVTKIHNEVQVYVDRSRAVIVTEAQQYVQASVTHLQQQANIEVVNLLGQQQEVHRDEALAALIAQTKEHEAVAAQAIARIEADAVKPRGERTSARQKPTVKSRNVRPESKSESLPTKPALKVMPRST
jgi:hypothetical protein